MKIHSVHILNFEPNKDWWDHVKIRPDDQLIEANIRLILSWTEYQELLEKDDKHKPVP